MKNPVKILWCVFMFLLLAFSSLATESVMFNYQGSVRSGGNPFDGVGYFKFALIDHPGSQSLWSNDGTSVMGSEPATAVAVDVEDGIFNVMIGDPSIGMEPINNAIFNRPDQIHLCIWFSDGTHGFQHLNPDRRIVNPQLIGIMDINNDFTIYVNGETGNDLNCGLSAGQAKKTIQGAVDILPKHLNCNVLIDIADGVYREQVTVNGINVLPGKLVQIVGDESWTPSSPGDPLVRVTGNDNETTATKQRNYCFYMEQSTNILLKGLLIDNAKDPGVYCASGFYRIHNCLARNNKYGFDITHNSYGDLNYCLAEHNSEGFDVFRNTHADFVYCTSRENTHYGIQVNDHSSGRFSGTNNASNNTDAGIFVSDVANIECVTGYTLNVNSNTLYGLQLRFNSFSKFPNYSAVTGNGTNISATEGSSAYTY